MLDAACEKIDSALEVGGTKKDIVLIVVSAFSLVTSLVLPGLLPFDPGWIAVLCCGVPIVIGATTALLTEFDIKADLLVSIALIASLVTGEVFAAGEVAVIMQLGGLLEELTVAKARKGVERLVEMAPQQARLVVGGGEKMLPAEKVAVGDVVRVLPGETIPVDGVIASGFTSIDQSAMTGESLPVDKGPGDEVMSGTVNRFGSFDMCATRVGEDSSIRRMAALVESADAGKAKIVRLADRWATWIVVSALTAAFITWLATGEVLRAVTVLVVFCPCALVLATPTAIVAAIGNATKQGFLVREGDALERLADVDTLVFDKTGTLTKGGLNMVGAHPSRDCPLNKETLLKLTAAAEKRSEHPVAKAIVASVDADLLEASDFSMEPGQGICAVVEGRAVMAGNAEMMGRRGIAVDDASSEKAALQSSEGYTLVHVAVDGVYAGFVALRDEVRDDSRDAIEKIEGMGLRTVLLTGDNREAASCIATEMGISRIEAQCLPEDKLQRISSLEEKGAKTCMIGDGVNDAPALKRAHASIAMGANGSDIAVDAADIAYMGEGVGKVPHLLALSRHAMKVIRANIAFSLTLNFIAIALAITAILDPVSGALVHNCGSVFVIVNSAFLLRWGVKS